MLSNDRFTFFKDQKAEDAGKAPLGVIEFDVYVSVRITAGDDPRFTILTSEVQNAGSAQVPRSPTGCVACATPEVTVR